MFLSAARDLITIFLALELSSIPQYILAGWGKDARSSEAGIKYLLLGAISSALLLYGMALLVWRDGHHLVDRNRHGRERRRRNQPGVLVLSIALLIAGFGFKMAIVPFQMWVPGRLPGRANASHGVPLGRLQSCRVRRRYAHLFRVVRRRLLEQRLANIFAVLAAVTMTVGNIVRNRPDRHQADAGILVGCPGRDVPHRHCRYLRLRERNFTLGASSVLLFLAAYAFTNLGAFIAIIAISQKMGSDEIKDYAGMWKRSPFLALALAFCLVSLTGIPPTVGFWGKMYIFNAGIHADLAWLVIIGVLNSVLSAYYYLGVARTMFLGEPAGDGSAIRYDAVDRALSGRGNGRGLRLRYPAHAAHRCRGSAESHCGRGSSQPRDDGRTYGVQPFPTTSPSK